MTPFTFHSDPGHGWLEVSIPDLLRVGLVPSDFSAYSYQHLNKVYLEEDCDATMFVMTYEQQVGTFECVTQHLNYQHWIRRLRRIEIVTDDDLPF
jgi:hypothetical protein